jgi:hypothetical protein
VVLQRGRDFDLVVLGISVGALCAVTPDLVSRWPAWARMLERVPTVMTQFVSLWTTASIEELGWTDGSTVLTGYAAPFPSWAEMTPLLATEQWPGEVKPRSIQYLVSTLEEPTAATTPDGLKETVRCNAIDWLEHSARRLWPRAAPAKKPVGFDYSVLFDPSGRKGSNRLYGQYWRANVNPTDRYVQSFPGTVSDRLPSDWPAITNLFLAGDWVRTGLSAGCVESAVQGGMQAARAICGMPAEIIG